MSANGPDHAAEALPPQNILTFLRLVGQLKTTKRTGWVYNNVNLPESVADHMYRMSLLTFTLPSKNRDHLMKLSLAHDLAECIVGDITPHDGVTKDEKRRREQAAMQHIRDDVLGGTPAGHELYNLWQEYEDGETADARLVKDVDRFEMLVQADEYERAQGMDLSEFFASTKGVFSTPSIQRLDHALREERTKRLRETHHPPESP